MQVVLAGKKISEDALGLGNVVCDRETDSRVGVCDVGTELVLLREVFLDRRRRLLDEMSALCE